MKRFGRYSRILMAIILSCVQGAQAETYVLRNSSSECSPLQQKVFYKIKTGDTLGGVLYRFNIGPLWGPQRFVDKTASSNQIPKRDTLRVNDTIVLPLHCQNELDKFITEEKNGDIYVVALKTEDVRQTAAETPAPAPLIAPVATTTPTPTPTPPPTLTPAPLIDASTTDYSTVGVDIYGEYSALIGVDKANGTTGKLLSKMDPGVKLSWSQQWDSEMRSELYFSMLNASYQSEKNGVALKNNEFVKTGFGASIFFNHSHRLEWGLGFSQDSEIFYRGSGVGNGLEFNTIPLLKLHPEFKYLLIERRHLSLSGQAGASWYSGGTYDTYTVDNGLGADLSLSVKHQMDSGNDFHCQAYFEIRKQNTSLLELEEKSTGLKCGLGWRMP
ncbi:hypothetical protein AZI86_17120 [Bdellovibrio bacteriovorus]|uniref:LysM domain-containing protein n=1 Tax=Bdellovibrio bacteriovorus TaxID=959 RepID=A0A150WEU5_BDEBC|nr:LysM peptidoglycan-binding domain-containing protein [Bdellovibrio bacteriovorus]KYG61435.1 hypothetical protein AZI86_17120 [Bdellovibrio bacteriovorus]